MSSDSRFTYSRGLAGLTQIMPPSRRLTVFLVTLITVLVIVEIVRGNPAGYIIGAMLLIFVAPMVAIVLVNRRALHLMEHLHMDHAERDALIEQYKDGYRVVREAVDQLSEAELDQQPAEGGWTPRQIVHHLADSETTSAIRLRRLLAENQPVIQGYDEELFARKLHYDRPIGASLELLRAVRAASAELLDWLTEEEWTREGTHSEQGSYSVEDWLRIYAAHAHDHAAQILSVKAKASE
jgi:hypothetical protein